MSTFAAAIEPDPPVQAVRRIVTSEIASAPMYNAARSYRPSDRACSDDTAPNIKHTDGHVTPTPIPLHTEK